MSFTTKEYDADEVVIYFNGIIADGYADGEFITVEQMSPAFKSVVGSNGEVCRSKTNDRRVKVTVKLLQSSATNALFSALHTADLNAPNGAGVGSFLMQDLQGGTICQGDSAWINSFPNGTMDREAKSREWEIEISNGVRSESGN